VLISISVFLFIGCLAVALVVPWYLQNQIENDTYTYYFGTLDASNFSSWYSTPGIRNHTITHTF